MKPVSGWAAQPPGPEVHQFFSLPCPHPTFLYVDTDFSSQLRWAVTIVEVVGCNGCNQDVEQNFTALGMVHIGSKIMNSGLRKLKICIKTWEKNKLGKESLEKSHSNVICMLPKWKNYLYPGAVSLDSSKCPKLSVPINAHPIVHQWHNAIPCEKCSSRIYQ